MPHDRRSKSAYIKSMTLTAKQAPLLALLLSGGLLIGAWIFQYVFGYPPCQMCFWQRHVHKVVLGIAVIALLLQGRTNPKLWAGLLALALLASFAMAFWHVGVEYKWWEGPKTCGAAVPNMDTTDLLSALDDPIRGPSCTEAVWHFLGLSMAAWNAIISLVGAGLMLVLQRKTIDA